MDLTTAQTYMTGVADQLSAAVARGDDETAEQIIDKVDADGYTDAAQLLADAVTICRSRKNPDDMLPAIMILIDEVPDYSAANAAEAARLREKLNLIIRGDRDPRINGDGDRTNLDDRAPEIMILVDEDPDSVGYVVDNAAQLRQKFEQITRQGRDPFTERDAQ